MKKHKFELGLRQKVIIVTDCGREGTIEKRNAHMFEGGTEAYYVRRGSDGKAEWYPRFSLALDEQAAEIVPAEITVGVEGEQPEIGKVI